MRIGDVSKDNYKDYLKLFNIKNAKEIEENINRVWGKDKEGEFDKEAAEKRMIAMGYFEEGMLLTNPDDRSHQKIVPVSDEIKEKLIETVRRQFLENGNGMGNWQNGDEISSIMEDYRKNIAPSERLSVSWTLSQIVLQEERRMIEYVRANQPGWDNGDPIDPDVLKAAVSGERIDTKA